MAGDNDIQIGKLLGLNTSGVAAAFGQPKVLENAVLDPRAGYTPAPGKTAVAGTYSTLAHFDIGNKVIAVDGGGNFKEVDLDSGAVLVNYGVLPSYLYPLDQGIAFATDHAALPIYYLADALYSTAPGSSFVATPTNIAPDYSGGWGYGYAPNGKTGFERNLTHHLLVMVLNLPYTTDLTTGTTLNPSSLVPAAVVPEVLKVEYVTTTNEFKIRLSNLNGKKVIVYGRGVPGEVRSYYEGFATGAIFRAPSTAYAQGYTVLRDVQVVSPSGARRYESFRFTAQVAGTSSATPTDQINWPAEYGASILDGTVTWVNVGHHIIYDGDFPYNQTLCVNPQYGLIGNSDSFVEEYTAKASKYVWGELLTEQIDANTVDVWCNLKGLPSQYAPATFIPFGTATARHLGRSWMIGQKTFRMEIPVDTAVYTWENATHTRTLYYSEPLAPWDFRERYLYVEPNKSENYVALQPVPAGLLIFGDSDAALLSGQSEANFQITYVDIPGTYWQLSTIVCEGVVYYLGVGGFYRLDGDQAVNIGEPIRDRLLSVENPIVSYDPANRRILVQPNVNDQTVYVYDKAVEGWSTIKLGAGTRLVYGNYSYPVVHGGSTISKLNGTKGGLGDMTVEFNWLDSGDPTIRKNFFAVSIPTEGTGNLTISSSVDGNPLTDPQSKTVAASDPALVRFRQVNRVGIAFNLKLVATSSLTLRPGWRIGVEPMEDYNRGY